MAVRLYNWLLLVDAKRYTILLSLLLLLFKLGLLQNIPLRLQLLEFKHLQDVFKTRLSVKLLV